MYVILFTGGGGAWFWGVWSRGGPRGCLVPVGSGPGESGPGESGPGGSAWWRPPRTATAAGGTHPTEMHLHCGINSIGPLGGTNKNCFGFQVMSSCPV